jgi:hypothetical protein
MEGVNRTKRGKFNWKSCQAAPPLRHLWEIPKDLAHTAKKNTKPKYDYHNNQNPRILAKPLN